MQPNTARTTGTGVSKTVQAGSRKISLDGVTKIFVINETEGFDPITLLYAVKKNYFE